MVGVSRGDWAKTVALITKHPSASAKTLAWFDEAWDCYKSIYQQEGMRVKVGDHGASWHWLDFCGVGHWGSFSFFSARATLASWLCTLFFTGK
jgi:hypothetical protein